jgi:polysaccharide biosynthesis protein PslH
MKILFLGTNLPVPTNNGQSIRTMSLIREFAEAGHELDFHTLAQGTVPESLHPLDKYCRELQIIREHNLQPSTARQYAGRVACLLQRRSYAIERYKSVRLLESVKGALAHRRFDVIVVDSIYGLSNLPHTDTPVFLNCHNAEFKILERYAAQVKNVGLKIYALLEANALREIERKALQRVQQAFVCSEDDGRILSAFNSSIPITLVPNTVDVEYYRPTSQVEATDEAPLVLFQGGMDWYPNRDAVEYFAFDILPLIRQEIPNIRFVVAGRNPSAGFIRRFRDVPEMQFSGTVPDLRPYLTEAAVCVVPLRVGGGTRIKILESSAAGKATVSTTVGAEGLGLRPNEEIAIADDPRGFAREVVTLLNSAEERYRMGRAARSAVERSYSRAALQQSLRRALSMLENESQLKPSASTVDW